MNDYIKSLSFWDETFKSIKAYKTEGKFVTNEKINTIFQNHINDNSYVLDYGCGSGWGIFEMIVTKTFKKGIAIDSSENSIKLCNECAKMSNLQDKLEFVCGDEKVLSDYDNYFDFIFSTNVLDVVPDEITDKIIDALHTSLKVGGYALICLNPAFTKEEMINMLKMEQKGNYFYKNEILRCNYKSINEWEQILSKKFELVESAPFKFFDQEQFERRLYLLKKN